MRQVGVPFFARRNVNVWRVSHRIHRRVLVPVFCVRLDKTGVDNKDFWQTPIATMKRGLKLPLRA